jgi:flagellar motor protein MotB
MSCHSNNIARDTKKIIIAVNEKFLLMEIEVDGHTDNLVVIMF